MCQRIHPGPTPTSGARYTSLKRYGTKQRAMGRAGFTTCHTVSQGKPPSGPRVAPSAALEASEGEAGDRVAATASAARDGPRAAPSVAPEARAVGMGPRPGAAPSGPRVAARDTVAGMMVGIMAQNQRTTGHQDSMSW